MILAEKVLVSEAPFQAVEVVKNDFLWLLLFFRLFELLIKIL